MLLSKIFPTSVPSENIPLRWDLFFHPLPIISVIISLILAALIWFIWKKRDEQEFIISPKELGASDSNLKIFFGWVPLILGIHTAIALLVNGILGRLFFSNISLPDVWSNWIGLAQILIALALFYGGLTRPAAILAAALWIIGLDLIGFRPMLESIQYLGFAAFFYSAGRGPYSIDRLLFPDLEPSAGKINYALLFLRIGVGLNLIIWAFTEKFANIPYVSSLLEQNPFLNFTSIQNEIFVLVAGGLELLAGILILFGVFPRITIIITLICINAALTIYDWTGLIDYLPLYAALAVLLIWEPNNPQQKLLWVEGLRKNMPERSDTGEPFLV